MSQWTPLFHTLLAFALFNLIGFRVFHVYSGILRYSQFDDLLRVGYASMLSLLMSLCFIVLDNYFGLTQTFYPLTIRMTISIFLGTTALLWGTRVLIRLLYDSALVGRTATNALVYGTREGAIALTLNARNIKPVRFLIEGYIGDEEAHYASRLMGRHIYSVHENLLSVIQAKNIKLYL